jgi:hypothetical protein
MSDYTVIVRKGEIFVKRWNSEIREYEEKKKDEQILSNVLQFPIVIDETTFGQFFALIAKEKEFYEKVFNSAMFGHPLQPFIDECALPPKGKVGLECDYVEVEWCCQEFEGEFEFWPGFSGYGDWPEDNALGDAKTKGGIAIEFTGLNEYKDLLLKLNTESNIYSLKQSDPLAKGTRKFEVYDVIKAILYEITWAGDISKGRDGHPGCEDEKSEAA